MWHSKALSRAPNERIIQAWLGGSLWRRGFRLHFKWGELRGTDDKTLSPSGGLRNGWQGSGLWWCSHSPRQATEDKPLVLIKETKRSWVRLQMADAVADVWMNAPVSRNSIKIHLPACTQAYTRMCIHTKCLLCRTPSMGRGGVGGHGNKSIK